MHLVVCGGKEKHVRLKACEKVSIVLCGEGPMKMQPVYQIQDGEEYEFNLISIKFEYFIVCLKVHGYVCIWSCGEEYVNTKAYQVESM